MTETQYKTPIEALAKSYHALSDFINNHTSDDIEGEEVTRLVSLSNDIALLIAPLAPQSSRDWALKLSVNNTTDDLSAGLMGGAIQRDIEREVTS